MRQQRHYGAIGETHRQLDEQQAAPPVREPPPQNQQQALRSWTHYGGMVAQQESANIWIRQNHESKMAANDRAGSGREGEGAETSKGQQELANARAAVEEARQREAAEQSREREQSRSR